MELKDNRKNFLHWTITSKEKRERNQMMILIMVIPLIGLVFITFGEQYFFSDYQIDQVFLSVVGVVVSVSIFFLINKVFPYAERTYSIDNLGISITKGKKNKKYLWEEFECYYPYSERGRVKAKVKSSNENKKYKGQQFRDTIFNTEKDIAGDIFYLKKKKTGFISKIYKKFVVVYGEAENSSKIRKILSRYLPRKRMRSSSDLGLVFYEFK